MILRYWSRNILIILLAGFLICGFTILPQAGSAESTPQVKIDKSSHIKVRSPSQKTLNNFRNNKDFQYRESHSGHPSIWEILWNWLLKELHKLFSGKYSGYSRFLLYLAIGLLFIYLILKIIQSRPENLFNSKNGRTYNSYPQNIKDISSIDFDAEIQGSVDINDYRAAIRWQYLKNLKVLSDRGLIKWRSDKTDNDYLNELRGRAFFPSFTELTRLFEYSWYGNFTVSESYYRKSAPLFQHFYEQVDKEQ